MPKKAQETTTDIEKRAHELTVDVLSRGLLGTRALGVLALALQRMDDTDSKCGCRDVCGCYSVCGSGCGTVSRPGDVKQR